MGGVFVVRGGVMGGEVKGGEEGLLLGLRLFVLSLILVLGLLLVNELFALLLDELLFSLLLEEVRGEGLAGGGTGDATGGIEVDYLCEAAA